MINKLKHTIKTVKTRTIIRFIIIAIGVLVYVSAHAQPCYSDYHVPKHIRLCMIDSTDIDSMILAVKSSLKAREHFITLYPITEKHVFYHHLEEDSTFYFSIRSADGDESAIAKDQSIVKDVLFDIPRTIAFYLDIEGWKPQE